MDSRAVLPVTPPALASMDFAGLLAEGLKACQQFGGGLWTDYNEHDPGVTILEQLCYAITDLGYRSDWPVADILAEHGDANREGRTTLFTGDRVLSCSPLSAADFRAMILDALRGGAFAAGVKDAWLVPSDDGAGLLDMLIELQPGQPYAPQQLIGEVTRLFHTYRNLGEQLRRVVVVDVVEYPLEATIDVAAGSDAEQVAAEVLLRLQEALTPLVRADSVTQLLDRGEPYDRIYQGPLQAGGIIGAASAAQPWRGGQPPRQLTLAVRGGQALAMLRPAQDPIPSQHGYVVARLSGPMFSDVDPSDAVAVAGWLGLVLRRDGMPVAYQPERVRGLLRQSLLDLHTNAAGAAVDARESDYRALPAGARRHLGDYESIQRHFPQTYGIGPDGVGKHDRHEITMPGSLAAREAKARQLKAYLLFFEQLLADCGAQLAHAESLFSLDTTHEHSYFWHPLTDGQGPPDLVGLLSGAQPPSPPSPAPPADGVYTVQVTEPAGPELLMRGAELDSLPAAREAEREMLAYGRDAAHYRIRRLGRFELYQLHLEGPEQRVIGYGSRRFDSHGEAMEGVGMLVMLMMACEADPGLRRQCITILQRGGREIALVGDDGQVYLEARDLTVAAQQAWPGQLLAQGINAGNYRVVPEPGGLRHVVLLDSRGTLLAAGRQRFDNDADAQAAIAAIVALVISLCCNPDGQRRHIRGLPLAPPPGPAPSPDAGPAVRAYKDALEKLVARDDPYVSRRHQFLDHLLARFGEHFDTDRLVQLAPLAHREAMLKQLIASKVAFLRRYVGALGQRGVDYGLGGGRSRGRAGGGAPSGLAARLELLLGLQPTEHLYGGCVLVLERVMLRGAPEMYSDVYVAVHLDEKGRRALDPVAFQALAADIAQDNCPAHLSMSCFAIDIAQLERMQALSVAWDQSPQPPAGAGAAPSDAAQALLTLLSRLDPAQGGGA